MALCSVALGLKLRSRRNFFLFKFCNEIVFESFFLENLCKIFFGVVDACEFATGFLGRRRSG
jgi:hypothetical protein